MASISPTTLSNYSEPYTGKNAYTKLHITEITQSDGATNKTYIKWKITVEGTPWTTLYRLYCTLGGKVLYDGKPELNDWRAGNTVASGSVEFTNESDGSLSLRAYIKQQFYYGNGDTSRWTNSYFYQENSTTMTCSTIPRYFSSQPTFTVKSKTETSVTFNWTTPETASNVQYKIGNGNWVDVTTDANAKSGSFTVSGLEYNKTYTIYGDFKRRDSGLWCQTKPSATVTTYDIPFCNSRPDFTLGNEVTLGFYNPLGREITFSIIANDGTEITDSAWKITGESYTGVSASSSTDKLYKAIPNAKWGYYRVKTTWGNYSWTSYENQNKYYVNESTNAPTFPESNITNVKDTLLVDSITGNSSKVIKGHNKITGSITKMTTKNHATGNKYVINANGTPSTQELPYDNGATKNFTIENLTTNSFSVTAYDSRGITTPRTKTVTLIDYSKPKVDEFTVTRLNGLGEYVTLDAKGSYTNWTGWSEIKQYNSIKKVWLRYKTSTSNSWSSWANIPGLLTVNANGKWEIKGALDVVFTVTEKYDFQFCVEDLLEESSVTSNQVSTANGFLWRDLKNKWLGINKKPTCALDVNGDVNVDGVITSRNKVQVENEVVATKVKVDSEVVANKVQASDNITASSVTASSYMKTRGIAVNENNGRVTDLEFKSRDSLKSVVRNDLLSSSVNTMSSKPGEGFVETRFWDAAGWDTQLFIPNSPSYKPHIRHRNANSDGHWENWKRFIMEDDVDGKLIYDSGSNSNGRWIRFTDGTMICSNTVTGIRVYLEANLSGRGVLYYGYNDNWTTYPQTFAEVPNCTMNLNTGSNVFCIQPYAEGKKDRPPGFYPMGVDYKLDGYITVSYVAHGRWK